MVVGAVTHLTATLGITDDELQAVSQCLNLSLFPDIQREVDHDGIQD